MLRTDDGVCVACFATGRWIVGVLGVSSGREVRLANLVGLTVVVRTPLRVRIRGEGDLGRSLTALKHCFGEAVAPLERCRKEFRLGTTNTARGVSMGRGLGVVLESVDIGAGRRWWTT